MSPVVHSGLSLLLSLVVSAGDGVQGSQGDRNSTRRGNAVEIHPVEEPETPFALHDGSWVFANQENLFIIFIKKEGVRCWRIIGNGNRIVELFAPDYQVTADGVLYGVARTVEFSFDTHKLKFENQLLPFALSVTQKG